MYARPQSSVLLTHLIALPVATDAAPRKVTKELADQLFQSPATPQDTALARSVKARLQAMGAASATQTAPGSSTKAATSGASVSQGWWANVAVDARSGHVRLGGRNLTSAQRAAAESAVKGMPDVMSWDWGN